MRQKQASRSRKRISGRACTHRVSVIALVSIWPSCGVNAVPTSTGATQKLGNSDQSSMDLDLHSCRNRNIQTASISAQYKHASSEDAHAQTWRAQLPQRREQQAHTPAQRPGRLERNERDCFECIEDSDCEAEGKEASGRAIQQNIPTGSEGLWMERLKRAMLDKAVSVMQNIERVEVSSHR